MNSIGHILALTEAYAAFRHLSESRVSTLVFGDGTRLKHLRLGGDMGVRRLERGVSWLSARWPEGLAWPSDVPRPSLPVVDTQAGAGAAASPRAAAPVRVSVEA